MAPSEHRLEGKGCPASAGQPGQGRAVTGGWSGSAGSLLRQDLVVVGVAVAVAIERHAQARAGRHAGERQRRQRRRATSARSCASDDRRQAHRRRLPRAVAVQEAGVDAARRCPSWRRGRTPPAVACASSRSRRGARRRRVERRQRDLLADDRRHVRCRTPSGSATIAWRSAKPPSPCRAGTRPGPEPSAFGSMNGMPYGFGGTTC